MRYFSFDSHKTDNASYISDGKNQIIHFFLFFFPSLQSGYKTRLSNCEQSSNDPFYWLCYIFFFIYKKENLNFKKKKKKKHNPNMISEERRKVNVRSEWVLHEPVLETDIDLDNESGQDCTMNDYSVPQTNQPALAVTRGGDTKRRKK